MDDVNLQFDDHEENLANEYDENLIDDLDENDEVTVVHSARLKFEEICESINNEERKIKDLEDRRQRLEKDMERLQKEIEYEKLLFREAIDIEIGKKYSDSPRETISLTNSSSINPLNIDRDDVQNKLRDYRQSLEQSQFQTLNREDDTEMQRLKSNLVNYKKSLDKSDASDRILKEKRKSAAKVFQKHLKEVETKCAEHIDRIENIQKNIDHFHFPASDTDHNNNKSY